MSDAKTLYEKDLLAWSKDQAEAFRVAARAGSNLALDWENLAEEIEDLGASQRSALHSQIRRIIEHFLKLENSPATEARRGWRGSIANARSEIDYLLGVSPSLRGEVGIAIADETKRALKSVLQDLEAHGEIDRAGAMRIRATTYMTEQILGDWFPPEP